MKAGSRRNLRNLTNLRNPGALGGQMADWRDFQPIFGPRASDRNLTNLTDSAAQVWFNLTAPAWRLYWPVISTTKLPTPIN